MISDRPDEVLRLSASISWDGMRPTSNNLNRNRLDQAAAQARPRRYPEAVDTLETVWQAAPQWLPHQQYARDVLGRVVERRRTLTPRMRVLATRSTTRRDRHFDLTGSQCAIERTAHLHLPSVTNRSPYGAGRRMEPSEGKARTLPCAAASAEDARRLVRTALRTWGLDGLADDGALVVTELVANAARQRTATAPSRPRPCGS